MLLIEHLGKAQEILFKNKIHCVNLNKKIEIRMFNNFNFLVGPYLGFIVSENASWTTEYKELTDPNTIQDWSDELLNEILNNPIKMIDYGLELGVSLYMDERIRLTSEYKVGLNNLVKLRDYAYFGYLTKSINVSVAYRFKTFD